MIENKPEINIELKTPEEILRTTSLKFNDLDLQAKKALSEKGDVTTYRQKLQERAQLIIELPSKIEESIERGNNFPESEIENLYEMASFAKKALKHKGTFSLGVLLEPQGSEEGDLNELEELIERVY